MSSDECRFDIISALPLEISSMIFRMLNPSAMKAALTVSKNWYWIYQSDPALPVIFRRRVRRRIREQNRFAKYLTTARPKNAKKRQDKPSGEKKRKSSNNESRRMSKRPRYDYEDTHSSAIIRPMRI